MCVQDTLALRSFLGVSIVATTTFLFLIVFSNDVDVDFDIVISFVVRGGGIKASASSSSPRLSWWLIKIGIIPTTTQVFSYF